MKTYMVTLVLLLFEVTFNFGHTLSKIELKNETEIYEIKEDQSTLLITHPKDEATKLREIIYYHIIERPYDAKDLSHDKKEPEFEKRFFTNGHSGIQFEKKDYYDNDDDDTSEALDDNSSEETNNSSNSSESNEEKDKEQSSNENDLSKVEMNDEDKSSCKRYGDNDSIKKNDKSDADDEEKSPVDVDSIQIDIRFSDFINTTEGVAKVKSATNVTADPETENEAKSETPQSRKKREINDTVTGKEKSAKTREGLNHADGKTPEREGTYGMSLTGNRGVMWNAVKPIHIEYHVGEPEALTTSKPDVLIFEDITTTESAKEPAVIQEIDEDIQGDDDGDDDDEEELVKTFAEIEKIFNKLIDNMDKTDKSESKQGNKTVGALEPSRDENKHEDDNEHYNDDSSLDPIEIEKSFIEIFKVFQELTGNYTSNPAVTDVNDATKSVDNADISQEKVSGESSNGNFLRTTKEDEEVVNDTPVKPSAKLAPKRNEMDKETSNKENDSKQQQFAKELLKNKYFWKWLNDASAAYLEILKKKLDAVIKNEVGNQIEQYFKEHKNESCKQDKTHQNDAVQEPVQTSNVTDENLNGNTTHTPYSTGHNSLASNDTTAQFINKSNETSNEISTKKHKDKPSGDKNAEPPVKIEAQNLFGSSVGSGKVTNIFIYNINKVFDVENIKPLKNDTNGVFVFGLDDQKPEQEKEDVSDKDNLANPDTSSENNKTVDKVTISDENQTSTAKPEAEKNHQSYEKDKNEDNDQAKDEDNVEHSADKIEVIPNDQTETINNDKTSTEISKESVASTEKPQEVIKDDKDKNTTTEKVEAKEDSRK